jgi:hypothetical protein
MSTPNPHRGQNAAVLLNRTYVFAAFGGRWRCRISHFGAEWQLDTNCPSGPPHPTARIVYPFTLFNRTTRSSETHDLSIIRLRALQRCDVSLTYLTIERLDSITISGDLLAKSPAGHVHTPIKCTPFLHTKSQISSRCIHATINPSYLKFEWYIERVI